MSHGFGGHRSAMSELVDVGVYAADLMHALSDEVCSKANMNEPRWAAYNILDRGDPNNVMLQDLLNQGLDYLDLKINGRREAPRQAITNVAVEVVLYFLSKLCMEDRQLMGSLHHNQQQEMFEVYNNFVGPVNREIGDHMYAIEQRQAQQQQQSGARYAPDTRGGYRGQKGDFAAPSYNSSHGRQPVSPPGYTTGGGHRGPGAGNGRPEFMNKSGHGIGVGTMPGFSAAQVSPPTLQRKSPLASMNKRVEPVAETRRVEPVQELRQVREDYRPRPARTETQTTQGNIMTQVQTISNVTEVQQCLNGAQLLSHRDGIKYVTVFDPSQEIAVYQIHPDGNVTDAYKPLTGANAVKFTDHNYEAFFAPRTLADKLHKPDHLATQLALQGVTETRTVAQLLTDIEKQRNITPEEVDVPIFEGYHLQFDEPIAGTGAYDHRTTLELYMLGNGLPIDLQTSVVSFTRHTVRPWIMPAEKCESLRMSALTHSWKGIRNMLEDLDTVLPSHHWAAIHKDVTQHVNEILEAVHGVRYTLDYFCTDIDDLVEAIRNDPDYGEVVVDAFAASAELICASILNPQYGEQFLIAYGYNLNEPDLLPKYEEPMGLYLIEDVTLLPIHSRDLSFAKGERVAQVSATKTPALHKALATRLKRATGDSVRVSLVTLDNQIINAFLSILDDSIVIMTV